MGHALHLNTRWSRHCIYYVCIKYTWSSRQDNSSCMMVSESYLSTWAHCHLWDLYQRLPLYIIYNVYYIYHSPDFVKQTEFINLSQKMFRLLFSQYLPVLSLLLSFALYQIRIVIIKALRYLTHVFGKGNTPVLWGSGKNTDVFAILQLTLERLTPHTKILKPALKHLAVICCNLRPSQTHNDMNHVTHNHAGKG